MHVLFFLVLAMLFADQLPVNHPQSACCAFNSYHYDCSFCPSTVTSVAGIDYADFDHYVGAWSQGMLIVKFQLSIRFILLVLLIVLIFS